MDIIDQLAVAIGVATLAGVNLYLTTLLIGLAIRFDWISLADKYADLAILAETPILIAAGIFFVFEFFADKIPWIDSLWDSVHTLVRPVGGSLLALQALGGVNPVIEVIFALLAGSAALVAHTAKAGTRLAINTSPEPVSNIAASTVEDVGVAGGVFLMLQHPVLFAGICLVFLGGVLWIFPKLYRRMKAFGWLVFMKLRSPAGDYLAKAKHLPDKLTSDEDAALSVALAPHRPDVLWATPALTGRVKGQDGVIANLFVKAVADRNAPGVLFLVGKRRWRTFVARVDLPGREFAHEPCFLSEDVVIYDRDGAGDGAKITIRFARGREAFVDRIIEALEAHRSARAPVTPVTPAATVAGESDAVAP